LPFSPHMLPRSKGGSEKSNNLTLLHPEGAKRSFQDCHVLAHQVLTRDEMAHWILS